MKKPDLHEFVEERKIDGVLYKSINEELYRYSLKKWEECMRDKQRHPHTVE